MAKHLLCTIIRIIILVSDIQLVQWVIIDKVYFVHNGVSRHRDNEYIDYVMTKLMQHGSEQ